MLLAFAGAFVVPALARAALLPACEHDPATRMPVERVDVGGDPQTPTDGQEVCNFPAARDDVPADATEMRVAAMCDARGASAIAPQRVLAIGDACIDAVKGDAADLYRPLIGPGPKNSPATGASAALADHAVLDPAVLVPPASSELAPPFPPVTGGPRSGIARGIDHPPR